MMHDDPHSGPLSAATSKIVEIKRARALLGHLVVTPRQSRLILTGLEALSTRVPQSQDEVEESEQLVERVKHLFDSGGGV